MTCFVYLIQSKSGNVKIGYSDDPHKRLNTLKTGSPEKIALHTIIKCKDVATAQQLEAFLHRLYSKYRGDGEWFFVDVSNVLFDIKFMLGLSSSVSSVTSFDVVFEEDQPERNEVIQPKLKRRNIREILREHFKKHPKDLNKDASELAAKLNIRKSIIMEIQQEITSFKRFAGRFHIPTRRLEE